MNITSAQNGLYLLQSVIGFADPRLARDVDRVGSAAIQIAQAVDMYRSAADFGTTAMSVGAAAMTGNALGAVLTLAATTERSEPLRRKS